MDWLEGDLLPAPFLRPLTGRHPVRVEDYLEEGTYVLRAELPGVDPDKDVEITVDEGMLTVKAERREEGRSEFHYGSFARTVPLPTGADESDVRASYSNGILEVRVGVRKAARPEPKHIPVSRGPAE
ncbi:Hsp20/alpha crystallin family protein [Actinopolymorpha cephalotaxi]|uniref:HSP20 family molecular chaperone IbpA n=1 Tax=Actinopolymorpha cephalotaxi TaxID=504797 RepID=A0ABX2S364_9ACTN|nr:Hsp20/alpha crystallin family protein [Actinopolymorpha cephalotaxi]NYH84066.1 HSP20 family molecular chaperone IbpA [Actinopolymorpha cephalotaxi]